METIDEIEAEARAWVDKNWDPDLVVGEWWKRLADAAYALPTLPEHAGGRGYDRDGLHAVHRVLAEADALGPPQGIGSMMAAPTIAEHGTPEQIERFVPPILEGLEAWCQLFSEPGAGSDLAGLQTRAVRDGDEWLVTGQKVWTSLGHRSDRGMLLARTDATKPKHKGIAWFAFPMLQDGVEVRPLVEMTGEAFFNEVFMDEARVGHDAMIGPDGEGWRVGNTTLNFERSSLAGAGVPLAVAESGSMAGTLDKRAGDFSVSSSRGGGLFGAPLVMWMAELAHELGRGDDPVIRDELMDVYIRSEVNRLTGGRARAGGKVPGVGNIGKLSMSDLHRRFREVGNHIVGPAGMVTGDDGPGGGRIQALTIRSPSPSIYGGTDEVQRNIIGERILGLPREPGPGKDTPFKDLPHN